MNFANVRKGQWCPNERTWELEKDGRRYSAIITSIPYGLNKASLVEKIGDLIAKKKIPQLVDIRDESTDEVRIAVDLKISPGRNPETEMENAMAYLCRYTPLQSTFPMNITCLVPTENPEVSEPLKANLHDVIRHWLDFRLQTVIKRFTYELGKLRSDSYTEAFAKAFDVLDEILLDRHLRTSNAKEQMMDRLSLTKTKPMPFGSQGCIDQVETTPSGRTQRKTRSRSQIIHSSSNTNV